ncbi:hypothetical protein XaplCFBP3123_14820 [Xanthomonas arboricola pv. populi]|nr:hypothetical protein XaplCFBP3123_14820 [Xanthomonas arboricola pv. populi]
MPGLGRQSIEQVVLLPLRDGRIRSALNRVDRYGEWRTAIDLRARVQVALACVKWMLKICQSAI